jgi:hypothetical protein
MKYKVKFIQDVRYTETCEAVVEAKNREDALQRIFNRDFTYYLVLQRKGEPPEIIEDYLLELSQVD